MKLFNQFNVLPRYITAFNYAGLNLNETPQELEKCKFEFQNFWEKECREHPTNQNCLIYCDWGWTLSSLFYTISELIHKQDTTSWNISFLRFCYW